MAARLGGVDFIDWANDPDKRAKAILEQRERFDFDGAILGGETTILAEAAGVAALGDSDFYEQTLRLVAEGRAFLAKTLTGTGCTCFPSLANFLMFKPPDEGKTAAEIFEGLLARGLIIRSLKSYGLPEHLRVSVGTPEENKLFASALGELIAHSNPRSTRRVIPSRRTGAG
jgi:hypothetical protein